MLDLETTASGSRVVTVAGNANVVPPIVVNAYGAMTVPSFWCAIAFLAKNLASFPRAVRRDGIALGDETHPLSALLRRRPNTYQNPFIFWQTFFYHAAVGNAYAGIDRDPFTGRSTAFHNLMPEDIYPFRYTPAGSSTPEQYYLHQRTRRVYAGADVLHLQQLGYDGMSGVNLVTLHDGTLQRAATIDRYQTKYLQGGTFIRGSIEFPRPLTDPQLEQVRGYLRQKFFGAGAEEDVLLLTDGAQLKNSTLTPQQSQLAEQSAASTKQIAQITGVDPIFMFDKSESKYSGVEDAGENVVRYTFRTWIEQAEDEFTMKLLTQAEQDDGLTIGINADALLRGNTAAQTTQAVATVNARIRTPDEARLLLGLAKSEDPEGGKLKALGDTSPAKNGDVSTDTKATSSGEVIEPADGSTVPQAGVVTDQTLNGAQITAAIEVVEKLGTKVITSVVAVELLVSLGFPREKAVAMCGATQKDPPPQPVQAPPVSAASDKPPTEQPVAA